MADLNTQLNQVRSNENVLEKINLTIPFGKKVAFVGTSGSGKSTIIKLLLRIYDYTSGDIFIQESTSGITPSPLEKVGMRPY